MDQHDWVLLAGVAGGFCAGVINAWAWLWPMSPERRDAFLAGTQRAFGWPWTKINRNR